MLNEGKEACHNLSLMQPSPYRMSALCRHDW